MRGPACWSQSYQFAARRSRGCFIKRSSSIFMLFSLVSLAAFPEALHKAHGRSGEVELGAQLVFQEALEAEVQRRLLVGEQKKRGRRRFGLGDVVDAHGTRLRRAAALQIDVFLEPPIQVRRGDAALAGDGNLIDQRVKLLRALAGLGGKKDDRRVTQEFQFSADHLFVVEPQLAFIQGIAVVFFVRAAPYYTLGASGIVLGGLTRALGGLVPFLHYHDD